MSPAGRFVSGLLLGAALAGIVLFWPDSDTETSAESAPPTTTTPAGQQIEPFLESSEVVVGATALLPGDLEVADGVARFSYELAGLGPTLGAGEQDVDDRGDVLTLPELWVLTTTTGATVPATTGPTSVAARFELPGADAAVAQIEVVEWRRAATFGERIELPIEAGATAAFRAGEAIIETVLEQRTSTIVQIDFDTDGRSWDGGLLRSVDPGWRVSGRAGGGIQLIWDGSDAPQSVILEDVSFEMRPLAEAVIVYTADMQP